MGKTKKDIQQLFNSLDDSYREEVADFAAYLLALQNDPNRVRRRFYICPTCFAVSKNQIECHDHLMVPCNAEDPEDCKPVMDESGEIKTPAPRWFVEATMTQSE